MVGETKKLKRNWRRIISVESPDRAIRIVPIKAHRHIATALTCNEFAYDFFEQFGKVESINVQRILSNNLFELQYVLVQFKDAKVADNLIRKSIITYDVEFEVTPLKRICKSGESIRERMESLTLTEVNIEPSILLQVPTEESPDNIMNALNDDCLRIIFEEVHSLSSLFTISSVCLRFNRILKELLPLKIRRTTICLDRLPFGWGTSQTLTLSRIEHFLRVLGSSVQSLYVSEFLIKKKIDIPDASNTLLKIVCKYCKNLQNLNLNITGVRDETLVEIQPMLSKLKNLEVYLPHDSNFGPFTDFISACTQLEYLHIYGWNDFIRLTNLPAIKLVNLINFTMNVQGISMNVQGISIDEFLLANPQIKTLETYPARDLIRIIANKMPNIQKLILRNEYNVLSKTDSISLRHLKNLKIEMGIYLSDSITNIFPMKNITQLGVSVLDFFDETLLIELTQNLYNLNKLEIFFDNHHKISNFLLKTMLQNARQLTSLRLFLMYDCLLHFDETDYYEILKVVKNRASDKKLIIDINCETLLFPSAKGVAGHKHIRLDMDPKWLLVSVRYEYGNLI